MLLVTYYYQITLLNAKTKKKKNLFVHLRPLNVITVNGISINKKFYALQHQFIWLLLSFG
jgi:hypothetical protein